MANPSRTLSYKHLKIREHINLNGRGIEYGPLQKPAILKSESDVQYVDFTDTKTLKGIYATSATVDANQIVDVDVVTGGERVINFVEPNSLDYIVASHVAEHVPDLISWLDDNLRILKSGGRLSICWPDKRFCFDLKRQSSTVAELIAAWIERRTKPNFSTLCHHLFYITTATPKSIWDGEINVKNAEYRYPRENIADMLRPLYFSEKYHDAHCWIFTAQELFDIFEKEIGNFLSNQFKIISSLPAKYGTFDFFICIEKTE